MWARWAFGRWRIFIAGAAGLIRAHRFPDFYHPDEAVKANRCATGRMEIYHIQMLLLR